MSANNTREPTPTAPMVVIVVRSCEDCANMCLHTNNDGEGYLYCSYISMEDLEKGDLDSHGAGRPIPDESTIPPWCPRLAQTAGAMNAVLEQVAEPGVMLVHRSPEQQKKLNRHGKPQSAWSATGTELYATWHDADNPLEALMLAKGSS